VVSPWHDVSCISALMTEVQTSWPTDIRTRPRTSQCLSELQNTLRQSALHTARVITIKSNSSKCLKWPLPSWLLTATLQMCAHWREIGGAVKRNQDEALTFNHVINKMLSHYFTISLLTSRRIVSTWNVVPQVEQMDANLFLGFWMEQVKCWQQMEIWQFRETHQC